MNDAQEDENYYHRNFDLLTPVVKTSDRDLPEIPDMVKSASENEQFLSIKKKAFKSDMIDSMPHFKKEKQKSIRRNSH